MINGDNLDVHPDYLRLAAFELLEEAGWVLNEDTGLREKDGEPMVIEYLTLPADYLANLAIIVNDAPPASWGPYATAGQASGIGTWSWLLWLVLAFGIAFVVVGVAFLLLNRQVIFSRGEQSV